MENQKYKTTAMIEHDRLALQRQLLTAQIIALIIMFVGGFVCVVGIVTLFKGLSAAGLRF